MQNAAESWSLTLGVGWHKTQGDVGGGWRRCVSRSLSFAMTSFVWFGVLSFLPHEHVSVDTKSRAMGKPTLRKYCNIEEDKRELWRSL